MPQVVNTGQSIAIPFAVVREATNRYPAESNPVIAFFPPDQAGALTFAAGAVVGQSDFQGGIHRFRAGVGKKHMVQGVGGDGGKALSQNEGQRVAHLEGRCEIQRRNLLLHGINDALTAMAGVTAPETAGSIQNLPTVGALVIHAFGAGQKPGLMFELTVGREGHPERVHLLGSLRCLTLIMLMIGGFIVHGGHDFGC